MLQLSGHFAGLVGHGNLCRISGGNPLLSIKPTSGVKMKHFHLSSEKKAGRVDHSAAHEH
jgi:hypothetical protein